MSKAVRPAAPTSTCATDGAWMKPSCFASVCSISSETACPDMVDPCAFFFHELALVTTGTASTTRAG